MDKIGGLLCGPEHKGTTSEGSVSVPASFVACHQLVSGLSELHEICEALTQHTSGETMCNGQQEGLQSEGGRGARFPLLTLPHACRPELLLPSLTEPRDD